MNLLPGDIVACINAKVIDPYNPFNDSLRRLEEGAIYSVESVIKEGVVLAQVKSSHPFGGYDHSRFLRLKFPLMQEIPERG